MEKNNSQTWFSIGKLKNIIMDKEKIIGLAEQIDLLVHDWIDGEGQERLQELAADLLEEVQKSDWVSVKDSLPEMDEAVLVCNENDPEEFWFSHRADPKYVVTDDNDFSRPINCYPITHWRRVEPLKT